MKKKAIAASALTAMALFGASQQAQARAAMIPAVAFGGGWATLVSIINKDYVTSLHLAYNYKYVTDTPTTTCSHHDGNMNTSQYDLTSFVVDGSTDRPNPIYGDNVGSSYAPALADTTRAAVGFLAIEHTTTTGLPLVAEAIVYNLSQRYIFSQRSIDLQHIAYANAIIDDARPVVSCPNSSGTYVGTSYSILTNSVQCYDTTGTVPIPVFTNYNSSGNPTISCYNSLGILTTYPLTALPVDISTPVSTSAYTCYNSTGTTSTAVYAYYIDNEFTLRSGGATTSVPFFSPKDVNTFIYVVGLSNSTGSFSNVFGVPYNSSINLGKASYSITNNIYDRLELGISDGTSLSGSCLVLSNICGGLIDNNRCQGSTNIRQMGGWFDLQNNGSGQNRVLAFKVEFAPQYGLVFTPLHPLRYSR